MSRRSMACCRSANIRTMSSRVMTSCPQDPTLHWLGCQHADLHQKPREIVHAPLADDGPVLHGGEDDHRKRERFAGRRKPHEIAGIGPAERADLGDSVPVDEPLVDAEL